MAHYCSFLTCFNDAIGGFCYLIEKTEPTNGVATSLQYRWVYWCAEHEEGEKRLIKGISGQYYDYTQGKENPELKELWKSSGQEPPAK